jgi:hypothetical protein
MSKESTQKNIESVDIETLGLSTQTEPDRIQLSPAPAMALIRYRLDYKTRYWDEKTKTGTPIVKFDAIDASSSEYLKFWTLSSVIYKNVVEIAQAIGVTSTKDSDGVVWQVYKKPVNIGGFEEVASKVRGNAPYLKIMPAHTS